MSEDRHNYILIDSTTEVCSAALWCGGKLRGERVEYSGARHSELLAPFVQELVELLPSGECLTAVGISAGPGSYTGLRIGASLAKALCMAYGVPLVAVETTEVLVREALRRYKPSGQEILMPMIDARRMEVYTALYDGAIRPLSEVRALVLTDQEALSTLLAPYAGRTICFFGNGAEKACAVLERKESHFLPDVHSLAAAMAEGVKQRLERNEVVDVAYWTPFYLKDYQAKVSQNKVLGAVRTEE